MYPYEPVRPGPTPIIRLDGADVVYHLWIARVSAECQMLVLRCDGCGEVFASIIDEREPCKNDTES